MGFASPPDAGQYFCKVDAISFADESDDVDVDKEHEWTL